MFKAKEESKAAIIDAKYDAFQELLENGNPSNEQIRKFMCTIEPKKTALVKTPDKFAN